MSLFATMGSQVWSVSVKDRWPVLKWESGESPSRRIDRGVECLRLPGERNQTEADCR